MCPLSTVNYKNYVFVRNGYNNYVSLSILIAWIHYNLWKSRLLALLNHFTDLQRLKYHSNILTNFIVLSLTPSVLTMSKRH